LRPLLHAEAADIGERALRRGAGFGAMGDDERAGDEDDLGLGH